METITAKMSTVYALIVCVLFRITTFVFAPANDYHYQRDWMDITVNLPVSKWYRHQDIVPEYWPIDYPPLTCWHQYICGLLIAWLEPESMVLGKSQKYITLTHMVYMRTTVLISELLIFIPSIILYFKIFDKNIKPNTKAIGLLVLLMSPLILVVDYDSFQYNTITLGFSIFAVIFSMLGRFNASAVFLAFAVCYKVYALYYSIAFAVYWVACSARRFYSYSGMAVNLLGIVCSGGVACVIIWLPWLNFDDFPIIMNRIFDFNRSCLENRVGNFWNQVDIFIQIEDYLTNSQIGVICALFTLIGSLPFLGPLWRTPEPRVFLYSIAGVSLSFYLFSYMVHEKSILFSEIPTALITIFDDPNVFQFSAILGLFSSYWIRRYRAYYTWQPLFYFLSRYYIQTTCQKPLVKEFQWYYLGMIPIHCLLPFMNSTEPLEKVFWHILCLYSFLGYCFLYNWLYRSQLSLSTAAESLNNIKKQEKII